MQNNKMGEFIEQIDKEAERKPRLSKDYFNIRVENQGRSGSEKRFQVEKADEEVLLNVGKESEKFLYEPDPNQGVEKPSPLSGFTNRKSSIAQIMQNYFS